MKASLITLGCAKNQVDSELVLGLLKKMGYQITLFKDEADLIIINTCGFIEPAKKEAINTIFKTLSNKLENQKIIVIGCLATRYKEELIKEIPEVDKFVSIREYNNLENIISSVTNIKSNGYCLDFNNRLISTPNYTAYIRIGDGCDNRCTYCAIPLIRGNFKSRKIDDIYNEAITLANNGYKEIILIAQDTTRFGKENNEKIEDLLIKLETIDGIEMIRLLYLYPDEISDDLINIIAKSNKIAHYFDIPIQHASNKILKLMNRRGTKEDIISIYNKIRNKMSDAIIRTTVMVGFPFEEDSDFNELIDFIKTYKFDRLGGFTYSPEEDTIGATFPQIDEKIKQERFKILMDVQKDISLELNKTHINKIYTCFIDGYDFNLKKYKARSYAYSLDDTDGYILISSKELLKVGSKVDVKIIDCDNYDLYGIVEKIYEK